jgi:hypothetical protein
MFRVHVKRNQPHARQPKTRSCEAPGGLAPGHSSRSREGEGLAERG